MAKINDVRVDMEKVEKGVWQEYLLGIELCVANINNDKYKKARQRLLKPHLRRIRQGLVDNEQLLEIIKPAAARHLLLDWKNIEDDNGNVVEYSYSQAMEYFNDARLVDFYTFVLEVAGENEVFRGEFVEESAGN